MNNYYVANLMIALVCIFLSGCQTTLNPESTSTEQTDSLIVVMPGFGGNEGGNALVSVKPMTFEELSKCGTKIVNLKKESAISEAENHKLSIENVELNKQSLALDAERLKVNVTSTKQVSDFNKRLDQHRILISQYNSRTQAHNSKTSRLIIRYNEFNTFCANRSYRQSDFNRLSTELNAAIASHSEISDIPLTEEVNTGHSANERIHIPVTSRGQ
jgi:hypothetical protein